MFNFIGVSRVIENIKSIVSKVSKTDSNLIIYGESGVGKDHLASYIHSISLRKDGPFVVIDCGAINEELAENELFGHIKGAYTDADSDFKGKVEIANGGTLVLDEVADLKLSIQVKLLRFLQTKTYQKLGSNEESFSDVRVIATTSKDLKSMIKDGKFREDLYYRLNVIELTIPPLRDRVEDIEVLVNYYFDFFKKKYNKNWLSLNETDYKLLKGYFWPGNVRELINVIEKVVIFEKNDVINKLASNKEEFVVKPLKDAINDFKREYIIKALDYFKWNQTKTSKALDIQRTYLARLIKELNINKID